MAVVKAFAGWEKLLQPSEARKQHFYDLWTSPFWEGQLHCVMMTQTRLKVANLAYSKCLWFARLWMYKKFTELWICCDDEESPFPYGFWQELLPLRATRLWKTNLGHLNTVVLKVLTSGWPLFFLFQNQAQWILQYTTQWSEVEIPLLESSWAFFFYFLQFTVFSACICSKYCELHWPLY